MNTGASSYKNNSNCVRLCFDIRSVNHHTTRLLKYQTWPQIFPIESVAITPIFIGLQPYLAAKKACF